MECELLSLRCWRWLHCEQFAALPAGAEANYDRRSEFYFDPLCQRYRSLAHCYYAQTRPDYYRKLTSALALFACCRLLVRSSLVCGNGRITLFGMVQATGRSSGLRRGTIKRTTRSGDRVKWNGCTGFS